ncbi:MAG: hypothetical protein KGI33_10355 [Thaumarchaeota archaeon]|nr:hypothetical protein [Nitrososphaerota archaeon]
MAGRKKIDEILNMSRHEIIEYLRETDIALQQTDLIKIIPFGQGVRAEYYHPNSHKPFKTRVFLKNPDVSG